MATLPCRLSKEAASGGAQPEFLQKNTTAIACLEGCAKPRRTYRSAALLGYPSNIRRRVPQLKRLRVSAVAPVVGCPREGALGVCEIQVDGARIRGLRRVLLHALVG